MRRIVFVVATALSLCMSAGVFAQGGFGGGGTGQSGFGGGSGGQSGFGGGMSGGSTSFSGGSSFSGSNSFTGSSSFTGSTSFSGGTSFSGTSYSGGTGPTAGGMRGGSGGSGFSPSTTNFESKTWANPMWSGRPGSTNYSPKTLGGFGQATLAATIGGATSTASRTGRTGTATVGRGGNYGNAAGALNGTQSPITYALEVRFPAPPIASPRVQADLQALIDRTSQLRQPASVRVEMVGNTVILRGRVSNEDERRLVEGMVRLEPGVHEVQNEIEIPAPPPRP